MSQARTEILSRLRSNKPSITETEHPIKKERVEKSFSRQELTEKFIEKANAAEMSITLLSDIKNLPYAVESFLEKEKLPSRINISDQTLKQIEWHDRISPQFRVCRESDTISLVHAFAGIAETGTLVSLSSMTLSTASLFLPTTCLFLLDANTIKLNLETAITRIKEHDKILPRTINLITGPSRTGDIEQKIQTGMHGPSCVHIFLVSR